MAHNTIYNINKQQTSFLNFLKGTIRFLKVQIEVKARTGYILTDEDYDVEAHERTILLLNQYLETDFKLDLYNHPELIKELAALEEKYNELTGNLDM